VKTGRLLKFQRPGGDVQAYLYQEDGLFRASVFVLTPSASAGDAQATLTGETEAAVESALRAWLEEHYPVTTSPR
jgi:negative regulator of sigma E activity